ncbi:winged helix-turn-helix domain-containing protein [Sandarakinorhabdus sp. AAP62]|uniref:winged helix-turn-helix domain-containing protein n=1 Tax=Sandarakinorhabdus sp. AAP62 TaxID=1248916 RepID=UPI0002E479AA|nr:winged helix-turn-helix domain-containing protein [Sandarakinorhabdus sp. AAP62]
MDRPTSHRISLGSIPLALADARILASERRIEGPAGTQTLEPQVMRVLLALATTPGIVQAREQLLEDCWDGVVVGEDSLNRAIAAIRRALRGAGITGVQVETLSKTGYRLVLPAGDEGAATAPLAPGLRPLLTRRTAISAGVAAGLVGVTGWLARPDPEREQAEILIARARDHWRLGLGGNSRDGVQAAEQAVALAPDHAPAWGMLALVQRDLSENGGPELAQAALERCEQAVSRAFALDPQQGEALAARAMIPPLFGDWQNVRRGLETVLQTVPGQAAALDALGVLHGSTGQMAKALDISLQQASADPMAALFQYKLIYRQWANGLIRDMDRTADRAVTLWPMHGAIWMARMWTYAYTGRAEAALRMLEEPSHSALMPPPMRRCFEATFTALASRRPADAANAIDLNRALSPNGIGPAVAAIQHLAVLGAPDAAMDVARGMLLGEGRHAGRLRNDRRFAANLNDQHRRKTLVLFIPATASLRAHAGFLPLLERVGMTDYWARAGVTPDFQARRAG